LRLNMGCVEKPEVYLEVTDVIIIDMKEAN
jgi:hypothetical protein